MTTPLHPGILVAFEGIDGAGKTTQAALLATRLKAAGVEVVSSKEPTGGVWGRRLRESAASGRLSPEEELAAFIEDRKEHVATLIQPSLEAGKVVIVDRYYFSTVAYQGARGMNVARIFDLNSFAPAPDLLVLLEVDPRIGVERIRSRGDEGNHFEREEDLARSAAIFAAMDFPYLYRIDGRSTVESIADSIAERLADGPVFDRLCLKRAEVEQCELANCGFWGDGSCAWPSKRRRLGKSTLEGAEVIATLNRIVDDEGLSLEERFGRVKDLLKSS